jgi:hypothetical protein
MNANIRPCVAEKAQRLGKVKFTIHQIDNGYIVESNYRDIATLSEEYHVKKLYLLDELSANTLPEAIEILKRFADDYMNSWLSQS